MGATRALIVDDNRLNRELLSGQLQTIGYATEAAVDGVEAWSILQERAGDFDVVLLDRRMPNMNGMEVLAKMKANPDLAAIPVIMQTAADKEEEIIEGIQAGAFYYLTKPFQPKVLLSITAAAVADYARYLRLQRDVDQRTHALILMQTSNFRFQTMRQGLDLAAVLAAACPNPQKRVTGLSELLVNAVEHGNLGITFEEKSTFIAEQRMDEEVEARLALPEHQGKFVEVLFERTASQIAITITDQGKGFDWQEYLDMDPKRVFETHGRGIALAKTLSFDGLEYRGCGNEVMAIIDVPDAEPGDPS